MWHVGAQHHHPTWWFWCRLGYGPKECTRHVSLCTIFYSKSPTFCPSCGVPSIRFYCELINSRFQNAVEFDLPDVLALFALTVCNCVFFLWLIGKFVFFSVLQPDRDWSLPQRYRLPEFCPFKRGIGKAWSAHDISSSTSEHGHEKTCGAHVSPRLRKLSWTFLTSLFNCKRCKAIILK